GWRGRGALVKVGGVGYGISGGDCAGGGAATVVAARPSPAAWRNSRRFMAFPRVVVSSRPPTRDLPTAFSREQSRRSKPTGQSIAWERKLGDRRRRRHKGGSPPISVHARSVPCLRKSATGDSRGGGAKERSFTP